MKYKLVFSYDGTRFHGFQRQKNVKNVQTTIESVLSFILKEQIVIKGSGRTDAGVHALSQCAHFETSKKISFGFKKKLNDYFEDEIVIKKITKVNDKFHARFSVKEKVYCYKINLGDYKKELEGYCLQLHCKLDLEKMKEAKEVFLGYHDYKNFVSGLREDYHSYIKSIRFKKKKDILIIYFKGIGFYRYMVRNLVGALIDVGKRKVTVEEIKFMLDNPDIKRQLSTANSCGLYLVKVNY